MRYNFSAKLIEVSTHITCILVKSVQSSTKVEISFFLHHESFLAGSRLLLLHEVPGTGSDNSDDKKDDDDESGVAASVGSSGKHGRDRVTSRVLGSVRSNSFHLFFALQSGSGNNISTEFVVFVVAIFVSSVAHVGIAVFIGHDTIRPGEGDSSQVFKRNGRLGFAVLISEKGNLDVTIFTDRTSVVLDLFLSIVTILISVLVLEVELTAVSELSVVDFNLTIVGLLVLVLLLVFLLALELFQKVFHVSLDSNHVVTVSFGALGLSRVAGGVLGAKTHDNGPIFNFTTIGGLDNLASVASHVDGFISHEVGELLFLVFFVLTILVVSVVLQSTVLTSGLQTKDGRESEEGESNLHGE